MTVNELVTWLLTQDQGAIVEVLEHKTGTGYYDQGGTTHSVNFDPKLHSDYTKNYLLLGVMNA